MKSAVVCMSEVHTQHWACPGWPQLGGCLWSVKVLPEGKHHMCWNQLTVYTAATFQPWAVLHDHESDMACVWNVHQLHIGALYVYSIIDVL